MEHITNSVEAKASLLSLGIQIAKLIDLKLAEKYVSIKCAALMSNPFCLKNEVGNWCCHNNFIMKVGGVPGFHSLSTEHF